jgi:transposase-like protein
MFLERGFVFTHEAVRDREVRFAPLLAEHLRVKRRGHVAPSWYAYKTYVKVQGKWCYLYRAIDQDGNLVDSRLSQKRDMDAAKQFFSQALAMMDSAPERVTTDGHASYPRAICETIGGHVQHRTSKYRGNRLEQDHRSIKQRYYPMHGFGSFSSASRFCRAFDARSSLLPLPYHYETKGFPGTTTRAVPPTIGDVEDHGSDGLNENTEPQCQLHILSSSAFSVLTHPPFGS